eukprot:UN06801
MRGHVPRYSRKTLNRQCRLFLSSSAIENSDDRYAYPKIDFQKIYHTYSKNTDNYGEGHKIFHTDEKNTDNDETSTLQIKTESHQHKNDNIQIFDYQNTNYQNNKNNHTDVHTTNT